MMGGKKDEKLAGLFRLHKCYRSALHNNNDIETTLIIGICITCRHKQEVSVFKFMCYVVRLILLLKLNRLCCVIRILPNESDVAPKRLLKWSVLKVS